jgi:general secretion pathway protein K
LAHPEESKAVTSSDQPARKDGEGFVLVAVIWLAGLIAAIAAGFAFTVRVDVLSSANIARGAEAEAVADGMARLTAFLLAAEPSALERAVVGGAVTVCRWSETGTVGVAVQDQAGLIDLNAAPTYLMQRLIKGLGVSEGDAERLAAAIADYRDADSDGMAGGFEPAEYPGVSFGPKNAPFQAIEELDQIPGMDEKLYRKLLPLVTVHSAQPGFDPTVTPPAVKQALGFDATGGPPGEIAGLAIASASQTFGIDVSVVSTSGARYRRLALVNLVRQPDRPYAILGWQRGGDFELAGKAERDCFN